MAKAKKACEQCGKKFEPRTSTAKYCTTQCRWDRSHGKPTHKQSKDAVAKPAPRTCPRCQKPFQPSRAGQTFCDEKCQKQRRERSVGKTNVHIVIPDTQCRPGVPNIHLQWIGRYIADKYAFRDDINLTVVHLGDHWDMPSLSSYDKKGGVPMEGRRILADIRAGNRGMQLLSEPFADSTCRRVFIFGNHEDRVPRASLSDAVLEGFLSLDLLEAPGWELHAFKEVVIIDGVHYSHYFYNPNTGRPYGGENVETRLKSINYSFTMGHQQGLKTALRPLTNGRRLRGLVAGSCYLHDEDYLGPQGNYVWRGILVCHTVEEGSYDLVEVPLDYLCRRYEGVRLRDFVPTEI